MTNSLGLKGRTFVQIQVSKSDKMYHLNGSIACDKPLHYRLLSLKMPPVSFFFFFIIKSWLLVLFRWVFFPIPSSPTAEHYVTRSFIFMNITSPHFMCCDCVSIRSCLFFLTLVWKLWTHHKKVWTKSWKDGELIVNMVCRCVYFFLKKFSKNSNWVNRTHRKTNKFDIFTLLKHAKE